MDVEALSLCPVCTTFLSLQRMNASPSRHLARAMLLRLHEQVESKAHRPQQLQQRPRPLSGLVGSTGGLGRDSELLDQSGERLKRRQPTVVVGGCSVGIRYDGKHGDGAGNRAVAERCWAGERGGVVVGGDRDERCGSNAISEQSEHSSATVITPLAHPLEVDEVGIGMESSSRAEKDLLETDDANASLGRNPFGGGEVSGGDGGSLSLRGISGAGRDGVGDGSVLGRMGVINRGGSDPFPVSAAGAVGREGDMVDLRARLRELTAEVAASRGDGGGIGGVGGGAVGAPRKAEGFLSGSVDVNEPVPLDRGGGTTETIRTERLTPVERSRELQLAASRSEPGRLVSSPLRLHASKVDRSGMLSSPLPGSSNASTQIGHPHPAASDGAPVGFSELPVSGGVSAGEVAAGTPSSAEADGVSDWAGDGYEFATFTPMTGERLRIVEDELQQIGVRATRALEQVS